MSDIKFAADGRHILARDYMTLKLWDLNMESKPIAVYPIHENLRSQVDARRSPASRPGCADYLYANYDAS